MLQLVFWVEADTRHMVEVEAEAFEQQPVEDTGGFLVSSQELLQDGVVAVQMLVNGLDVLQDVAAHVIVVLVFASQGAEAFVGSSLKCLVAKRALFFHWNLDLEIVSHYV